MPVARAGASEYSENNSVFFAFRLGWVVLADDCASRFKGLEVNSVRGAKLAAV